MLDLLRQIFWKKRPSELPRVLCCSELITISPTFYSAETTDRYPRTFPVLLAGFTECEQPHRETTTVRIAESALFQSLSFSPSCLNRCSAKNDRPTGPPISCTTVRVSSSAKGNQPRGKKQPSEFARAPSNLRLQRCRHADLSPRCSAKMTNR